METPTGDDSPRIPPNQEGMTILKDEYSGITNDIYKQLGVFEAAGRIFKRHEQTNITSEQKYASEEAIDNLRKKSEKLWNFLSSKQSLAKTRHGTYITEYSIDMNQSSENEENFHAVANLNPNEQSVSVTYSTRNPDIKQYTQHSVAINRDSDVLTSMVISFPETTRRNDTYRILQRPLSQMTTREVGLATFVIERTHFAMTRAFFDEAKRAGIERFGKK